MLKSNLLRIEKWVESATVFLFKFEPKFIKQNKYRHWIPIGVALIFVVIDNFLPFDYRIRLQLTPIEIDWNVTIKSTLKSMGKVKHIVFFFLLYFQLQRIWPKREGRIALVSFLISFFIEFEQAFIAGREARPLDLIPNVMGYTLAYWYLVNREKRGKTFNAG